ncbi:MAG TPA: hypothetical protein VFV17_08665 [Usitatibacteraceae bacterium]|nr:hypothetical protein [Usitatibacteraceae bacterium]
MNRAPRPQNNRRTSRLLLAVALLAPALAARAGIDEELRICYEKTDAKDAQQCFANLIEERDRLVGPREPFAVQQKRQQEAAEDRPPARYARNLRDVMLRNLDPSYVTLASGVHFGNDRTSRAILYEAQLFTNISWFRWPDVTGHRDGRFDFWLDLPIRIGLRQLTDNSLPVRTPSYNPGIRLFMAQNQSSDNPAGADYFSIGLFHFSNGQEGDSCSGVPAPAQCASLPSGQPRPELARANVRNQSFNTNYLELAAHRAWKNELIAWGRLAFRQDFYGTWDAIQRDQYPRRQLSAQLRSAEFGRNTPFDVRWSSTYRFGFPYLERPGIDNNLQGRAARVSDKLQTTLEFTFKPPYMRDLSLYARYDLGYDDYNINFQNRVNRLQFGFVAK